MDYNELLPDFIDGLLSPEEERAMHYQLSVDKALFAEYKNLKAIFGSIDESKEDYAPSVELTQKVFASLGMEVNEQPITQDKKIIPINFRIFRYVATAAAVLLLFAINQFNDGDLYLQNKFAHQRNEAQQQENSKELTSAKANNEEDHATKILKTNGKSDQTNNDFANTHYRANMSSSLAYAQDETNTKNVDNNVDNSFEGNYSKINEISRVSDIPVYSSNSKDAENVDRNNINSGEFALNNRVNAYPSSNTGGIDTYAKNKNSNSNDYNDDSDNNYDNYYGEEYANSYSQVPVNYYSELPDLNSSFPYGNFNMVNFSLPSNRFTLEIKNTVYFNQANNEIHTNLANIGVTLYYRFIENLSMGIDIRDEAFRKPSTQAYLPLLERTESKSYFDSNTESYVPQYKSEDVPTTTIGLSLKYDWANVSKNFKPTAQILFGRNQEGFVGRVSAGCYVRTFSNLTLNLGVEYSTLAYKLAGEINQSSKIGINCGLAYNF